MRRRARNLAAEGKGPLFQRDYWAVIRDCTLAPSEIGALLAARFSDFSPATLARFERADRSDLAERPLALGDELSVHIRFAGSCAVRLVHQNANSVTLATLAGHPEAGRITFGAYRNDAGDVVFHIRSRARSSSSSRYAGFLAMGEPMQTNTWTDFIDCLANTVGGGVEGSICEETQVLDGSGDDEDLPTYLAEGS